MKSKSCLIVHSTECLEVKIRVPNDDKWLVAQMMVSVVRWYADGESKPVRTTRPSQADEQPNTLRIHKV